MGAVRPCACACAVRLCVFAVPNAAVDCRYAPTSIWSERIPTAKEELFGFSLEWAMVDSTLMEKRIKPWINKKIIEYIGEEEQSLVEYICQKVRGKGGKGIVRFDASLGIF